ncbi:hypothetical protein [Arsenophonus sp.]|uniref:hypothetical protein n=1 Tax=Arsenophonus sp. TaxID=1872640 RepID=UPI003879A08C
MIEKPNFISCFIVDGVAAIRVSLVILSFGTPIMHNDPLSSSKLLDVYSLLT